VHCTKIRLLMSLQGQNRKSKSAPALSASTPTADIDHKATVDLPDGQISELRVRPVQSLCKNILLNPSGKSLLQIRPSRLDKRGVGHRHERWAGCGGRFSCLTTNGNDINGYISQHGGWVTSFPGSREITFDALPGSALPDQLTALGYTVVPTGTSERILPHQIVERFGRRADGELELLTEGSTKSVAEVRQHAGIVKVRLYAIDMPP